MKLTCPACNAQFPLDAGANNADANRFAALLAGLPPQVGKALVAYLGVFRSATGCMAWSKLYHLAKELDLPIRDQRLTWKRKQYVVTHATWAEAMHLIAERPATLTLPLTSHGYLYSIVASASSKMQEKAGADAESRKHQAALTRGKEGAAQQPLSAQSHISRAMPENFKSLIGGNKDENPTAGTAPPVSPGTEEGDHTHPAAPHRTGERNRHD